MKSGNLIALIVVGVMAGAGGWYLGKRPSGTEKAAQSIGRKILFYQSAMHPWIKSDKPGNCTICGMKLTPIYEGDQPITISNNIVQLGSNSVTVMNVQTTEVTERPLKRSIRAAGIVEDDDTRH